MLLTEKPLADKADREKMAQIMFETFNVPRLHIAIDSALSLFASGRATGLVVNSGNRVTHTVPIHEGRVLHNAVEKMDVGGLDLCNRMQQLFVERGDTFSSTWGTAEREIVRDIKEKLCYVAQDFDAEMKRGEIDKSYEMPDGHVITVGTERFRCPELLFKGAENYDSLPATIAHSISQCDRSLRKELLGNVLLSGGNTMFEGLAERIQRELHVWIVRHKYAVDGYLRACNEDAVRGRAKRCL